MSCEYCEPLPTDCYKCTQRRGEELRERLREMEERHNACERARAFEVLSTAVHSRKAAALAYYEAMESGDAERIRAKLAVLDDAREQHARALERYRVVCPDTSHQKESAELVSWLGNFINGTS